MMKEYFYEDLHANAEHEDIILLIIVKNYSKRLTTKDDLSLEAPTNKGHMTHWRMLNKPYKHFYLQMFIIFVSSVLNKLYMLINMNCKYS